MYNIDYYCYTYRLMMPVQLVSALYQKRVINYLFIYLFICSLRVSLLLGNFDYSDTIVFDNQTKIFLASRKIIELEIIVNIWHHKNLNYQLGIRQSGLGLLISFMFVLHLLTFTLMRLIFTFAYHVRKKQGSVVWQNFPTPRTRPHSDQK